MARKFIVFDTETTGLLSLTGSFNQAQSVGLSGAEVIQIGGIVLDERMEPTKCFCHYCDCVAAEVPPATMKINNLSMREIRKYVPNQFLFEVMVKNLPEFFEDDVIFIGYNVGFDIRVVRETLRNSPRNFVVQESVKSIVPKTGRYSVDVLKYVAGTKGYRPALSSFEKELKPEVDSFIARYANSVAVETNCIELLEPSWREAHNSFFDALETFILWRDRVWRKKLV